MFKILKNALYSKKALLCMNIGIGLNILVTALVTPAGKTTEKVKYGVGHGTYSALIKKKNRI